MLISRAKIKDLPVAAEGYKLINQDGGSSYFSINSFAFADNKGSDNYMK